MCSECLTRGMARWAGRLRQQQHKHSFACMLLLYTVCPRVCNNTQCALYVCSGVADGMMCDDMAHIFFTLACLLVSNGFWLVRGLV